MIPSLHVLLLLFPELRPLSFAFGLHLVAEVLDAMVRMHARNTILSLAIAFALFSGLSLFAVVHHYLRDADHPCFSIERKGERHYESII